MPFLTDSVDAAAVEKLQKQIDDIVQELNLLKEQQALQTGPFTANFKNRFIMELNVQ